MKYIVGQGGEVRNRGLSSLGPQKAARICASQSGRVRGFSGKKGLVSVKSHARAKAHQRCFPILPIKKAPMKKRSRAKKSRGKKGSVVSAAVRRSTRVRKPRKMLVRGEGR